MAAVLGERAGLREPVTVHNFYVPAGGDIPDPAINTKFAHKLAFLDEMRAQPTLRPGERAILVGDLNVAPLEHDVWSHKQMLHIVSHTPIECEKLIAVQQTGGWVDAAIMRVAEVNFGAAMTADAVGAHYSRLALIVCEELPHSDERSRLLGRLADLETDGSLRLRRGGGRQSTRRRTGSETRPLISRDGTRSKRSARTAR